MNDETLLRRFHLPRTEKIKINFAVAAEKWNHFQLFSFLCTFVHTKCNQNRITSVDLIEKEMVSASHRKKDFNKYFCWAFHLNDINDMRSQNSERNSFKGGMRAMATQYKYITIRMEYPLRRTMRRIAHN